MWSSDWATCRTRRQLQPQLSSVYIEKEVALLRSFAAPKAKTPEQASLEVGDGRLVIQHVDVVNIYVTIGPDASASLPGVQSQ